MPLFTTTRLMPLFTTTRSYEVRVAASPRWADGAAASLNYNGFVVLRGAPVPDSICKRCNHAIVQRMERLLAYAGSHGVDTVLDQFTSREICQRGFCSRRYDLDMPLDDREYDHDTADAEWSAALGSKEELQEEAAAWASLRAAVDPLATAVIERAERMLHRDAAVVVETPAAGAVVSVPGAKEQHLHRDGPSHGCFNSFIPLVPLTAENGATQLVPRTHRRAAAAAAAEGDDDGAQKARVVLPSVRASSLSSASPASRGLRMMRRWAARRRVAARRDPEARAVAPLLGLGDVLIFDYTVLHQGKANLSSAVRPIAYVQYAVNGARDYHNFPQDTTLRDYCERLRATSARLDRTLAVFERVRDEAAALTKGRL